ncbi:PHP domain-containing protein [Maribacter sp. ANRC-HE7]|uniref:PHP domain-containing protein n=1 Tax=Maribacter aquimaris TaxID=2737171 RepID=A0ABR7UW89_9FLAO|nr:PHP domain-containing protein [Maribacter aquimaris]MBD0776772.1 PHP domain-containing protein [Maribacter aquimaris]
MKGDRIKKYGIGVLLVLIVALAVVFHFEIYFENALTGLPETDFGVGISNWRILFEPFLGPLLFLNRSIYALRELPMVFLWVLIVYLVFSGIFGREGFRKKKIGNVLLNVLLMLGICFSIFVLILFVPLPNNTIVNNSKNAVLVTTHAHTEYSHDGLISQEGMWRWHQKNGFDAFFITDHANHKKSLEFAQAQRKGAFPMSPLVLVGQEHSGSNHMSLLGLDGAFETKRMSDEAVVDSVHAHRGVVIINHWFDGKGKEKEFYRHLGADGFEIENVGSDLYYDRDLFSNLKKFCSENDMLMVGGLDFHGYGRACSVYNAFEIPNWDIMDPVAKEHAILTILKDGPQEKIKILIYKDRPYYSDSNLIFRPFFTVIDYFRTLHMLQVISWVFWVILFCFIGKWMKSTYIDFDLWVILLAGASALFLLVLAMVYYVKGEKVKGYSDMYTEYMGILGPVGLVLLIISLFAGYFRFFKPTAKSI